MSSWVLSIIKFGYVLEFESLPQCHLPLPLQGTATVLPMEELYSLVAKGPVEEVPLHSDLIGYYSRYFAIDKKDGGRWSILDLCGLNIHLHARKFGMLSL